MRTVFLLSALCLAACAATQQASTTAQTEEDKQHVAEAIKYGYRLENNNGQALYCRSDWATGSHIEKNTVCLTAGQLDDLARRNDRDYTIPNRSPVSQSPH